MVGTSRKATQFVVTDKYDLKCQDDSKKKKNKKYCSTLRIFPIEAFTTEFKSLVTEKKIDSQTQSFLVEHFRTTGLSEISMENIATVWNFRIMFLMEGT